MRIFKNYYPTIFLFLLPGLSIYIYFFALPVFQTFIESFFYWEGLKINVEFVFVGLKNYIDLFKNDPYFWKAFLNTLKLMVGNVVFQTLVGFTLAMLLNSGIRFKRFLNIAFFMPVVLSATSVSLMWRFIFHPDGLINRLLELAGFTELITPWLANPVTNINAILVVIVWQGIGIIMILFLAGLVGIPKEVLESCVLVGAGRWDTITLIIIPMLKTVFITVITLILIGSAKAFDVIWILTSGGPFRSSEVLTTLMYRQGMLLSQPARGGTTASFIFLFLILMSYVIRNIKSDNKIIN